MVLGKLLPNWELCSKMRENYWTKKRKRERENGEGGIDLVKGKKH